MPRTKGKVVSESNGPIPQDKPEFGRLTMEEYILYLHKSA